LIIKIHGFSNRELGKARELIKEVFGESAQIHLSPAKTNLIGPTGGISKHARMLEITPVHGETLVTKEDLRKFHTAFSNLFIKFSDKVVFG